MNGFTSGVFRDPFDIGWKTLDVEVVAVEIGALFLAEIGRSSRALLDVTRPKGLANGPIKTQFLFV